MTDTTTALHEDGSLERLTIDTIRTLSMDAVQKANSGHPGTPMALAPVGYTLWSQFLRYDPSKPDWPNRDRFVLSAGHGCMLQYSLMHLTGYPSVSVRTPIFYTNERSTRRWRRYPGPSRSPIRLLILSGHGWRWIGPSRKAVLSGGAWGRSSEHLRTRRLNCPDDTRPTCPRDAHAKT